MDCCENTEQPHEPHGPHEKYFTNNISTEDSKLLILAFALRHKITVRH